MLTLTAHFDTAKAAEILMPPTPHRSPTGISKIGQLASRLAKEIRLEASPLAAAGSRATPDRAQTDKIFWDTGAAA